MECLSPRGPRFHSTADALSIQVEIGDDGLPVSVPPVHPGNDQEHARHELAARRREMRLVFSGRLKLEKAVHIKDDLLAALAGEGDITS